MSLTSKINESYNARNISNIGLKTLSKNLNQFRQNQNSSSSIFLLKTIKRGHLYRNPNYTAYNKQSLGSIPTKVEKTLIKQQIKPYNNKTNKSLIKSNSQNIINHIPPPPTIFQNPKNYTTSYSSKGFGIGFVSKVSRFKNIQNTSTIGPGDYYPEKNYSIENNVIKSHFGKSMFIEKKCKSLSKHIEKSIKNNNDIKSNNNNFRRNKKLKNSYYFESTSERFKDSITNGVSKNDNPGPGRYLKFIDYIKKKDYYKLSPGFVREKPKAVNIIKKYLIDENDNKKYGYCIYNKEKVGRILKGLPPLTVINRYFNSSQIINSNFSDITIDLSTSINKSQNERKCNKNNRIENIQKVCTFGEQDWDDKLHRNDPHFQMPGPAYYFPKLQKTRKSFNSNNKDFICINSSMDFIDERKIRNNF